MKRSALIFIAAIFVPSLVLGWLALRTAGEQRILIEQQAVELHQAETDAIAARTRALVEEKQAAFVEIIRELVAIHGASALAETYDDRLTEAWKDGGVPFAISPEGRLAFPMAGQKDEAATTFLTENRLFLSNEATAEIYNAQQVSPASDAMKSRQVEASSSLQKKARAEMSSEPRAKEEGYLSRKVVPQKRQDVPEAAALSNLNPEYSDFQSVVKETSQGILARFVQDKLQVLFWTRPDPQTDWVFGLMLGADQLDTIAASVLAAGRSTDREHIAILDDKTRPIAREPNSFTADWKRPFVATEIGDVLPHWEVALYLSNPGQLTDSARLVTLTLTLLITLALAAILGGGFFVAADTRRQLALAQKKTDFVSNVSHELKTPLTSIRMFADLLVEGRVTDPEKRDKYLRIISGESERLTRLVNNVLDFARLEKHRKTYEMRQTDLYPVITRLWESEGARLRESDFALEWDAAPGPYELVCDADAVSQVLVNLLSNAEKYSTDRRELSLSTEMTAGGLVVEVRDRGLGVARGLEGKIFDPFFRADDSLASAVQGSGLGLTLARRIVRDHGGDITCRSRSGGGTVFRFQIPPHPPKKS